jgi:hypothetical protein
MMKKAENFKSTSFHRITIYTTAGKLKKLAKKLGASYGEYNTGRDKSNFDFEFETEDGTYFTVYDWKEYRKIGMNERIEFHIGGNCPADSEEGKRALKRNL